jgi:hypothetical protein
LCGETSAGSDETLPRRDVAAPVVWYMEPAGDCARCGVAGPPFGVDRWRCWKLLAAVLWLKDGVPGMLGKPGVIGRDPDFKI